MFILELIREIHVESCDRNLRCRNESLQHSGLSIELILEAVLNIKLLK